MICYKDRSWCIRSLGGAPMRCMNERCSRNLTDAEQLEADKWAASIGSAGEGAPIAVSDFFEPDCGFEQ